MSKLIIVESPSKAKTIQSYLGSGYKVMASVGHVRDLPSKSLGVNIDKGFKPQYLTLSGKEGTVRELKAAAAKSDGVLLATDPDREGEAISWHLATLLGLDINDKNRVTFGEITPEIVKEGIKSPRAIDQDLVDAQQARRILDRIIGYKISPLLWSHIKRGLSAGRVQSVVVKMLVDREREIQAFVPEEYWTVEANLRPSGSQKVFNAKLTGKMIDGKNEKLKISNQEECEAVLADLEKNEFFVDSVTKSKRHRKPQAPFITSTLQQDASRRLGFTSKRTMKVAQELYEGMEIPGHGSIGLITYMRTDSTRISDGAHQDAVNYISSHFGDRYAVPEPRSFSKKKAAVAAQDAHEAIRPTYVDVTPDSVKSVLSSDQFKLYDLIWKRFIASRMADQILDTVSVDILNGDYIFHSTGYTVRFDGFTSLYEEAADDKEEAPTALPELTEKMPLRKKSIKHNQCFTQPPQRYTDATIIAAMEEFGIGRPSTYATTVSTIVDHGYAERQKKILIPTQIAMIVTDVMEKHFPDIVDVGYSAKMEDDLDKVEAGKVDWQKMLDVFYKDFKKTLDDASKGIGTVEVPVEETDVVCEQCGRYGKFLACPGYPKCKNAKPIIVETSGICPVCGEKMVERKSKRGRLYYACSSRSCNYMTWNEPVAEACPQCGKTLFKKKGKNAMILCEAEGCGYKRSAE